MAVICVEFQAILSFGFWVLFFFKSKSKWLKKIKSRQLMEFHGRVEHETKKVFDIMVFFYKTIKLPIFSKVQIYLN